MKALNLLAKKLGYVFTTPALLEQALTHRSAKGPSNERLEFLGDAVLNFTIAAALYEARNKAMEGELSRLRANLVNGRVLAEVAQAFELGDFIRLGSGELRSGGSQRASILADAMEAIIGAIFVDGGFEAARHCILQWFATRLQSLDKVGVIKDAKTQLQEYLQARKYHVPIYTVIKVQGKDHDQLFIIECKVDGMRLKTQGEGHSRRIAEQIAAENFLQELGVSKQ